MQCKEDKNYEIMVAVVVVVAAAPFMLVGISNLVTSTFKRFRGTPAERGAIEIVPYVPLLRKDGLRVVVEWITFENCFSLLGRINASGA